MLSSFKYLPSPNITAAEISTIILNFKEYLAMNFIARAAQMIVFSIEVESLKMIYNRIFQLLYQTIDQTLRTCLINTI